MTPFEKALKQLKFKFNSALMGRAMIMCVLIFLTALHIYYISWLGFGPQAAVLSYINMSLRMGTALVSIFLLLRAYNKLWDSYKTSRWMDVSSGNEDDIYQNLYELKEQKESPEVIELLSIAADRRIQEQKLQAPGWFEHTQAFLILFFLVGTISFWALSWDSFPLAIKQFYTNKPQSIVYKESIEVSPGNITVGRAQEVWIQVLNPETRLEHKLFFRYDKIFRELALSDWRYLFNSVETDIEYYITNSIASSDTFKITCLDEPYARRWETNITPPAYTGLNAVVDTLSMGNIDAYLHSMVKLNIQSNIPIKQALMRFEDGRSLELKGSGNSFSTQFRVQQAENWYLELTDALGRKNRPEEKSINIIADSPPEIRILFPAKDTVLDQRMNLPLIMSANDDFGLRDLQLVYQINDTAAQSITIKSVIPGKIINLDYVFDLAPFGLFPGDKITYWMQIWDNSPMHQKAESKRYVARFPSIAEIYQEIEQKESLKTSQLQSAMEQAKDLQQEFEQKRRELLKNPDADWEDKKQLQDILEKQEDLADQVDDLASDFQELINQLQNHQALSEDVLNKMQRIQELMEEISNDELRAAMDKMNQALEKMNPEELRKAMESFKFSMQDFMDRIDQSLDLLESIKKEQAIEKVLQMAGEIEKSQAALKDKALDPSSKAENLAADQDKISESYQELKEALDELEKMLDSNKDKDVKQQLDQLKQDMKQSNPEADMKSSSANLRQNKSSEAQSNMESALQKMRRFTLKMKDMKESMGGQSMQEITSAMQRAIRELLIFSTNHEKLQERLGTDPYPIMQELIAQYDGLQILINKFFSTPQVTMFVPPKFYLDLTDTNNAYRELFIQVSERQYHQLPQQMQNILKGLNLMIYDLMQAMNSSSSGGGGGGMQSLMQMLQQMGQEQMMMNMLTQALMQQLQEQGGRMDAAMQKQVQKLASDQQRLADNLKRALQNDPEAQKQANTIKQIIEEAEAVARQLRANQLSPDIMRRQENIISRLLDAQRSINKRDTTQKRKAETATQQFPTDDLQMDLMQLRRAAMLDDSYKSLPNAWQQVIIKYLKLLSDQAP